MATARLASACPGGHPCKAVHLILNFVRICFTAEETAFMKLQASFLFLDKSAPSQQFLLMG